jgi:hypothetical protein
MRIKPIELNSLGGFQQTIQTLLTDLPSGCRLTQKTWLV